MWTVGGRNHVQFVLLTAAHSSLAGALYTLKQMLEKWMRAHVCELMHQLNSTDTWSVAIMYRYSSRCWCYSRKQNRKKKKNRKNPDLAKLLSSGRWGTRAIKATWRCQGGWCGVDESANGMWEGQGGGTVWDPVSLVRIWPWLWERWKANMMLAQNKGWYNLTHFLKDQGNSAWY